MATYLPVHHDRFVKVDRDIFIRSLSPDCMKHVCRLRKDGDRIQLDACCQYGVDVDTGERDGILSHRQELQTLLRSDAAGIPWFSSEEKEDKDFPSGRFVRTTTHEGGCVFLSHDKRGCAIHRASIEGGWDFHGIKPNVCRLFPLSYDDQAILISDDYADYSCAFEPDTPSMYRVGRSDLSAIFGKALVLALDEVEKDVLCETEKHLGVLR